MKRTLRHVAATAFVLSLALPASAQQAARFQSTWETSFGTITLIQEGPLVWGSYTYHGGKLIGSISGGKFYGFWWEDDDSIGVGPDGAWCGPLVLVFDAAGTSFHGTYGKHSRGESTFWTMDPSRTWDGKRLSGTIDLTR